MVAQGECGIANPGQDWAGGGRHTWFIAYILNRWFSSFCGVFQSINPKDLKFPCPLPLNGLG